MLMLNFRPEPVNPVCLVAVVGGYFQERCQLAQSYCVCSVPLLFFAEFTCNGPMVMLHAPQPYCVCFKEEEEKEEC